MKGLPRAIVLGLLSSLAGEGRKYATPSGPGMGHQPIGVGTARFWRILCSEKLLPKEAGSPGLTRIQNLGTAAGKKVERQASGSAPSVVFPPALLRLPAPSGSSSPECERKLSASRVCVFSHCAKLHGRAEGWEELKMKGPFFSSLC